MKSNHLALLLAAGSAFLLYRALSLLLIDDALTVLAIWALALLLVEIVFDFACLTRSLRWLTSGDMVHARPALRLAVAVILVHAVRVAIYVLGRTGPWHNFDVRPEQRATYTYDPFWVWVAATLSAMSVLAMLIFWAYRRSGSGRN